MRRPGYACDRCGATRVTSAEEERHAFNLNHEPRPLHWSTLRICLPTVVSDHANGVARRTTR